MKRTQKVSYNIIQCIGRSWKLKVCYSWAKCMLHGRTKALTIAPILPKKQFSLTSRPFSAEHISKFPKHTHQFNITGSEQLYISQIGYLMFIYLLYPSFNINIWEEPSNNYRSPNCLGNPCSQGAWTLTLAFLKGWNHVPMAQGPTSGDKQLKILCYDAIERPSLSLLLSENVFIVYIVL